MVRLLGLILLVGMSGVLGNGLCRVLRYEGLLSEVGKIFMMLMLSLRVFMILVGVIVLVIIM